MGSLFWWCSGPWALFLLFPGSQCCPSLLGFGFGSGSCISAAHPLEVAVHPLLCILALQNPKCQGMEKSQLEARRWEWTARL